MRRKEKRGGSLPEFGHRIPPELADPSHALWHNQQLYGKYMRQRGWSLPPQERLGVPASPGNRRRFAAKAWAAGSGIQWDWPRLRSWGLCD